MRLVKAKNYIHCPVRANLLGGWTDQLLWKEKAAVINFSMGWEGPKCPDDYPLTLDTLGRFRSAINGRGTGLGISSIRAGMMYRQSFPEKSSNDYIKFVLEYEKAILGTEGGWQDQIGGLEPGFKLITTPGDDKNRHKKFKIIRCDNHPVVERIILFDTRERRNAGNIGDLVRDLMQRDRKFQNHLRKVAELAEECFEKDADEVIKACNFSWQGFLGFVPKMKLPKPLPKSKKIVGHMLLGAGGGGFGIVFVDKPESRQEVIEILSKSGFWATVPKVMSGIKLIQTEEK
ncbi:MAG: hypothetical protein WC451_03875 [Patescibacteria group bacterium]|jgi:galactokinase/mevalonate kinase-like predicted kinase